MCVCVHTHAHRLVGVYGGQQPRTSLLGTKYYSTWY